MLDRSFQEAVITPINVWCRHRKACRFSAVGGPCCSGSVSVFTRPPDVVTRDPVTVMLASCADELSEIQRLWPWFEELVGLRGRKMYGAALVDAGPT